VRILHLTGRLNARGGAGVHLLGVVAAQVEAGHAVAVAAGHADDAPCAGAEVSIVPGLDARVGAPVDLDETVRRFAPDVVHLHTVVNPRVLEWARGRAAVITVQDHRYFCPARGKWTADGRPCTEALERALCASCFDDPGYYDGIWTLTRERLEALRALRVVVLSEYMREELRAAGLDGAQVHVVPPFASGVEGGGAGPAGPPCVLFAGRLTASKGVADAVEAWRRADVGLPLLMAGAGALREWAGERGATMLGWVDRAGMAGLFARAAALLLPSRWQEPFGIVGLEALVHGVPVVAWRSGGIPEWHPGGDTLVEWGDVDGLAAALRRVVGRRAQAPPGFGRGELMSRLHGVYQQALG